MLSDKKVHVVSHSHWDREWYFTACDSLVLMDKVFTEILDELASNEKVNFCLDGQISIVEEYLELHPEKEKLMKQLVQENRLFIGPWYTQTDTKMVSLASIVSNLYYGIWKSDALFGKHMRSGYLPDTFGFSNQLPMLLNQFEIDNFIFWRGTDYEKQGIGPYFTWIGQDGSEVTAINLYNSYGMAKGLTATEKFIHNVYLPLMKKYDGITQVKDILMPVGNDQNAIVRDLDKKIAEIGPELVIDSYEGFAQTIKGQLEGRYQGELNEGRYSRVHKSAGSIRASLKKVNYDGETLLSKETEPLNAMAREEGLGVSVLLIQKAWKLLFEGQAHDSIVGCVSDSVTEDILNRGKRAIEIGKSVSNYVKKEFAASIGLKEGEILIFNTEPFPFDGYKEVEVITHHKKVRIEDVESCSTLSTTKYQGCPNALVETPEGNHYEKEEDYYIHRLLVKLSLPSFGYRILCFCEETLENLSRQKEEKQQEPLTIAGGRYRICYENGSVTLHDGDTAIQDFISLTDMGNDGDTYDFSPVPQEMEVRIAMQGAEVTILENVQIMEIDCTVELPYCLEDRKLKLESLQNRKGTEKAESSQTVERQSSGAGGRMQICRAKITLSLRDDEFIYASVTFDNQVLSHRVRMRVRGPEKADFPKATIAAVPGGTAIREISTGVPENWTDRYVEYPIDIEMNTGFVGFCGTGKQLTVLNKGVREYQASENSIYMTLFASCPELGKPDLLYRPGRASGDTTKKGHVRIYTPMAQELGEKTWEFAITFMENDDTAMYQALERFEAPSVFYQAQNINLFYERIDNKIQLHEEELPKLEREKSYLELDKNLIISSIYNSLYDGYLTVRAMVLKDRMKQELTGISNMRIGNLLERGEEDRLQAYRLYTLKMEKRRKGDSYEH